MDFCTQEDSALGIQETLQSLMLKAQIYFHANATVHGLLFYR